MLVEEIITESKRKEIRKLTVEKQSRNALPVLSMYK